MFLLWKTTGDVVWRERAWKMFEAIERHAKVPGGAYATRLHVNIDDGPANTDEQQRYIDYITYRSGSLTALLASFLLRPSSTYTLHSLRTTLGLSIRLYSIPKPILYLSLTGQIPKSAYSGSYRDNCTILHLSNRGCSFHCPALIEVS